ncbi:MAG: DNA-binding response regulator [Acidobacteriota bacterium]
MKVRLRTDNLLTRAWLAPIVEGAGGRVLHASDPDEPDLLVVDLTAAGALEAIARTRSGPSGVFILVFGPHVHSEVLRAAREAGANEVVARGAAAARIEKRIRSMEGPR